MHSLQTPHKSILRRFAPLAAVICATGYLPPKVKAGTWILEESGSWSTASNWSGGIPNAADAVADFDTNFGLSSTVTLSATTTIGSISFTDPRPQGALTISGSTFTLSNSSGDALFNVSQNNTLTISSVLAEASAGEGLKKTGLGTLVLSGSNTYSGPTTITGGILQVSSLANGGSNSNIGKSSNAASNLVIDGGILRYTGGTVTINRGFTMGAGVDGATIDASGSGTLNFTGGTLEGINAGAGANARTLTLRGTSTGTNVMGVVIGDLHGGATSVVKRDTGVWRLNANNTYTGTTTVMQGTLQVDASGSSKIPDASTLVLGGFPGGGTFNLAGGTLTEVVAGVTIDPGANTISRSTTTGVTSVLKMGTITVNEGGTVRFAGDGIATTTNTLTNGILGGWAYRDDNWATTSGTGPDFSIGSYTTYSANTAGNTWAAGQNINYTSSTPAVLAADTTINSLRFDGTAGPNVLVRIDPAATLTIGTGGLLATSANAPRHISGGAITSGSDTLYAIIRANNTWVDSKITGDIALTKSGGGGLVIFNNEANDYTGHTYINEGGLYVRSDNALGTTGGQTFINGGFLDFQGVHYAAKETVKIFSGELRASSAKSIFDGDLISADTGGKAILNIGTWLELNGNLSGSDGFQKSGGGTLVVNGNVNLSDSNRYVGSGDLALTSGYSTWRGTINISGGSVAVTGGNHSLRNDVTLSGGRVVVTGGNLSLTKDGATYDFDIAQSNNVTTILSGENQTVNGNVHIAGGSFQTNGNAVINGSLNAVGGNYDQLNNVRPEAIPNVVINGPATFTTTSGSGNNNTATSDLYHNTTFNGPVKLGFSGSPALNLVGIGKTTFNESFQQSGGTAYFINAEFGEEGYTAFGGTIRVNGMNVFNGPFNLTGTAGKNISLVQEGLRRSDGLNAVRDVFKDGIHISGVPSGSNTVVADFRANNVIEGDINISGNGPGFAGFGNTVDVPIRNAQEFNGALNINGGRVYIENANALGAGFAAGGQGINITGEKSIFLVQRGVATNEGEDIVIGPTTGYVTNVVVTNRGTGYTSAPSVTFSGGGGSGAASGAVSVSGGFLTGVIANATNVGSGYTSAPTVTFGGPGTGATGVAILSGVIALRANDQHNIWNGSIIVNNVQNGAVTAAPPVIAVSSEDSLEINGNIYGGATAVTSGESRLLTTATLGGVGNSSAGFFILNGQVKDKVNGAATGSEVLRTVWGGHHDLNVWVNKEWGSNGMITLGQGVMRFTAEKTASTDFFGAGVTGAIELSTNNPTFVGYNQQDSANGGIANTGNNIAFFLTKPGQTLNTPSFTVHNGNTDKVNMDGSNTGLITIGGENTTGTVTYGTGTGSISLVTDVSSQIRDLRLFANRGGTVDIKANLIDAGAGTGTSTISKTGDGTVRLLGSSAGAGTVERVYALAGTLELAGFGTNNNQRTASTAQLHLGGGTLQVTGDSVNVVSQDMTGAMTVRNSGSTVQLVDNGKGVTLNLGATASAALTRNTGGTVRFVETGTNASITLNASSGLSKDVPLGWATFGTATAVNSPQAATHFATVNTTGSQVDAFLGGFGEDNLGEWGAADADMEESVSGYIGSLLGSMSMNTIRFNVAATSGRGQISMGAGNTLTVTQGILVSSLASGSNRVITGGKLQSGAAQPDLLIHNYGGDGVTTGPSLTIASQITGSKALTVRGDGVTILTNPLNDYTGNTYVSDGTLRIGSEGALGSVGTDVLLDNGTLHVTDNVTFSSSGRDIYVLGDRATVKIDAGKTLTMRGGSFAGEGSAISYVGNNAFHGDLVIDGGGTLHKIRSGSSDSMNGQLIITGNSRLIVEGDRGDAFGGTFTPMDGTVVNSGATLELRPTNNYSVSEFLRISGAGQDGLGAIQMRRPEGGAATDRDVSWLGPVTLGGDTTIFVDDSDDAISSQAGIFSFNDNIFEGGGYSITKKGDGILRFVNNRVQNLSSINVEAGELRFEGGVLGTIGTSNTGNNFFTGTSSIVVGTGSAQPYGKNPRLFLYDQRGDHNVNITLNGAFMAITPGDAPYQAPSFSGTITLNGPATANAIEIGGLTRANPVTISGPLVGSGGFTKLGYTQIQLTNPNNSFTGELIISRSGHSQVNPSMGLYDQAALTGVSAIRLLSDATLHIDNLNGLDSNDANNNRNERINDNAALYLSSAARLRYLGNPSAASSETMGALHLGAGSTAIELDPQKTAGTAPNVSLTFESYNRSEGAVTQFRVHEPGIGFGTATGANTANIIFKNAPAPSVYIGGNGAVGATNRSVLLGAFGGVATRTEANYQGNTTSSLLYDVERNYIGRHFMTVETSGGKHYVRPLAESEYVKPGENGASVYTVHNFNPADYTAGDKNVRLTGGFGPFTSYTYESSFATQPRYEYALADNSRRQDSVYKVSSDVSFNTLSFAQTPTEFLDGTGNRILVAIDPGRSLTLSSGMLLHAGYGTNTEDNGYQFHNANQQAYIRGGTLEFGDKEIIIHNVAGHYRENNQTFSGGYGDLAIYSNVHGTKGLTKTGPSQVILGAANSYSGPTRVAEGPLRIENPQALGNTNEVQIMGTGEFRLGRGIEVSGVPVRFSDVGTNNYFRNEFGYNIWNGDVQIDSALSGGNVQHSSTLFNQVGTSGQTFVIKGNIYALNSSTHPGATDPFAEFQRQDARLLYLQGEGAGGVIQLRGNFRDTVNGPVTVTSATENQVLRSLVTGSNEHNVFVYNAWDSAGRIYFRQGSVRLMPEAGSQFYTNAAMTALNPFIDQSRPIMADTTGGDANLLLTTDGQSFNSPLLMLGSGSSDASYMIGGENTSGTVRFFNFGTQDGAVANLHNNTSARTNTWNRNVRFYANEGGTVEVWGRITDGGTQGSYAKVGRGTVILRGMDKTTSGWVANTSNHNDFDKQLIVAGGTLVLDYDTNDIGAGTTNQNGRWGWTATDLVLAGGRIQLLGESERATTQQYTDLIVRPGSSSVVLNAGTNQNITLTISGNYTQNSSLNTAAATSNGGTVNFVEVNNGTGVASIILNGTATSGHNFGGTNALVGPWATYGNEIGKASSFAFRNATTNELVGFNGFTDQDAPASWVSGQHVRETAAGGFGTGNAVSGVKTITFAGANASTVTLGSGFTIGNGGTADEGAILIPSGVTAAKTISGGTLTVNGNKSLYVHHYGDGKLAVDSQLTGSFNLVKTGSGTMSLGADNTPWSGKTFINGGVLEFDAENKLGVTPSSVVADKLTISGGTLRYTSTTANGTISANRGVILGGDGGTFDVPDAARTLTISSIIASENNPGLQLDSTTSYLARNPFSGDLIKTGSGVLALDGSSSNTYTGLTHVKQGVLSLTRNNNSLLGTNVGALDGTIVEGGATLRFANSAGDITLGEWITFREGSTIELNHSTARGVNLDGVITLEGTTTINYVANGTDTAGNSPLRFGNGGGYLTGPGDLIKNSVNNGYGGGILEFRENMPEWTGNLYINGGRVIVYSQGKALGSGNTVFLGTTGAVTSPAVSSGAYLWFSPENAQNPNGASNLEGVADSIPVSYSIDQNIVVNKELSGTQSKSMGVASSGLALDRYNFNGDILLDDDLTLYYEESYSTVSTGGEFAYINFNGDISTGSPNGSTGNLTTSVSVYSRPSGFVLGTGNDMHVVFALNGDNTDFAGKLTVGNSGVDPDLNHIVRLGNNNALKSDNNVELRNQATLQAGGHTVTIGTLTTSTEAGTPVFSAGGNTTAYITSGSRAIVENASSTPGSLRINQDGTSVTWNALFRDGVDPDGGVAAPLKLIKGGSAIVTLAQENQYSGGTVVAFGTLLANDTGTAGSATGTGMVTVNAGATLGGDGRVMGANISGTIAPGPGGLSVGRGLKVEGGLTLNDGAGLSIDIFGKNVGSTQNDLGYDQLNVIGSVSFKGEVELMLDFDLGLFPMENFVDVFTIILNDDTDPVSFASGTAGLYYNGVQLTEGMRFEADNFVATREFEISYMGGDGNDVVLRAVPEPATALTLLGGVGMLLGMRRMRRRS